MNAANSYFEEFGITLLAKKLESGQKMTSAEPEI